MLRLVSTSKHSRESYGKHKAGMEGLETVRNEMESSVFLNDSLGFRGTIYTKGPPLALTIYTLQQTSLGLALAQ